MEEVTRIFLIRHGTTEWNREEIFRGRADCGLNESGRAEARALADYWGEHEFAALYSSPLARARQTAEPLAAVQGLQVILDPAFIDLDFGDWQGRPRKEVQERYPDLYRQWLREPQGVTFPRGENLARVRARVWAGLQRVIGEQTGKTAVIVSHRVITKILMCAALGLDDSHFWQIKQDTTAVNCIEYTRGIFVTSLLNDTCHLKSIRRGEVQKDF